MANAFTRTTFVFLSILCTVSALPTLERREGGGSGKGGSSSMSGGGGGSGSNDSGNSGKRNMTPEKILLIVLPIVLGTAAIIGLYYLWYSFKGKQETEQRKMQLVVEMDEARAEEEGYQDMERMIKSPNFYCESEVSLIKSSQWQS